MDVIGKHERCSAVSRLHSVVGGKLYVFGGWGASGRLSTAEVYDPASDSWAQVSSLTAPRYHCVAAAL